MKKNESELDDLFDLSIDDLFDLNALSEDLFNIDLSDDLFANLEDIDFLSDFTRKDSKREQNK